MSNRRADPRLHALTACLLFACGPKAGSSSSDGSAASTDSASQTGTASESSGGGPTTGGAATTGGPTTGGVAPAPCTCITPKPIEFPTCDEVTPFTCDLPPICGRVGYWCPRPNQDFYACKIEYAYDEAALECALTALRDRTPGVFTAGGENEVCGFEGCGADTFKIAIATPESAVLQSCSESPISLEHWSTEAASLAPAAHFQTCLDMPAAPARYQCLFDGLQQRVPVCE